MITRRTRILFIPFIVAVLTVVFAGIDTTRTQSFSAGVWVRHPGIAVGKLSGPSGEMITVVGDDGGRLHAWRPNGAELSGFPKNILNQGTAAGQGGIFRPGQNDCLNSTPALVDIDGNGTLEIFVGSGDGFVYGFTSTGMALSGWPKFTGISTGDGNYGVFASPCVADIDGDGVYEVIAGAFSHLIWAWKADGSVYPGWPFDNTDTVWSSAAVADFNHDGKLEIVVGGDSTVPPGGVLRMFRYNGEQVSGWPRYVNEIIQSSPAIGDIDNDGRLEIAVGSGLYYGNGAGEYVLGYEADGTAMAGWPANLGAIRSGDNRPFGSPALADVDGDGQLETFVGAHDGFLYCVNANGTVRWSRSPGPVGQEQYYSLFSSPVIGDVDGNGVAEVVIGGGAHITAFNALDGSIRPGYPVYTGTPELAMGTPNFSWSSPTIADIDQDGLIDLLIGWGRENEGSLPDAGGVKVYHESGPVGTGTLGPTGVSPAVAPWPRFRRDNHGRGSTAPTIATGLPIITSATVTPPVFSPNGDGFFDTVTLSFTLSQPDSVTVDVLDRTGTIVDTLLFRSSRSGTTQLAWDGLRPAGTTADDGPYSFAISGASAGPVLRTFGLNNSVPEVNTLWYLAEGSTVGFDAFVLIQNPNFSPANATVTFIKQDGTTKTLVQPVTPRTRLTVAIHDPNNVPNYYSVSTRVTADLPIIVERAMYFSNLRAAHNTAGVTNAARTWYFAGNRAFAGDEDFILIVNPSTTSATTVTATFYFDNQAPTVRTYPIAANSRYTIAVHGVVPGVRSSVRLHSDVPIAAERAFYTQSRAGGAAGAGAVSPSLSWYFADGDTSNITSHHPSSNVATFLEMFNPGTTPALVLVNFMLEDGTVTPLPYNLAAQRRLTLDVSSQIGTGKRFSMELLSNAPIVAERMMFSGSDVGDTIGSPTPALVWNLAEGFTAFGYETWIVVSNPGSQTANITMNFLRQSGINDTHSFVLGPKQRLTAYVNALVPEPTSVSTQVTSDVPVVVERTMKFSGRLGIHQSMGIRQ